MIKKKDSRFSEEEKKIVKEDALSCGSEKIQFKVVKLLSRGKSEAQQMRKIFFLLYSVMFANLFMLSIEHTPANDSLRWRPECLRHVPTLTFPQSWTQKNHVLRNF